jgi:DNA gyrase/topoisomerase IV subunit A
MHDRDREMAEQQLRVLELVEAAMDRRDEVFAIVDAAADSEEAERRIRELFEVQDPHLARAVLDLQVSRWTRTIRAQIRAEVARLRELLDQ